MSVGIEVRKGHTEKLKRVENYVIVGYVARQIARPLLIARELFPFQYYYWFSKAIL